MGDTVTGSEASLETSAELEDDDFQLVGKTIAESEDGFRQKGYCEMGSGRLTRAVSAVWVRVRAKIEGRTVVLLTETAKVVCV